jgi:serine/threonine-protein kinase
MRAGVLRIIGPEKAMVQTLEGLLRRGRVPLDAAIDCVRQTLETLGEAHALGAVHHDIHPGNIVLDGRGGVALAGFGAAAKGSPHYLAPEQVWGDGPADARSDLYSLGVVLYEAATGRKPFTAESAFWLMLAHVDERPPAPSEVEPAIGPALEAVILRALAKKPALRFQTAAEFLAALEAAAGAEPTAAFREAATTSSATEA